MSVALTINVGSSITVQARDPRIVAVGTSGPAGPANSLSVSGTTTVAYGTPASVVVSGSAPTQSLTFTIPTGPQGSTGAAATITVGTKTTGAAGSSVNVVNSGTSSAAVLDFTIPRGDKGDIGNTGPQGDWSAAQPNRQWSASPNAGVLVTSDAGKLIFLDSATAISVTTSLALATGQRIDFLVTNATPPAISAATGVTLAGTPLLSGGGVKFRDRYSAATLICTGSNSYVLVGDLAAS